MTTIVTINVPSDPGGPTAGGGGLSDTIFKILSFCESMLHPIRWWKAKRKEELVWAKFVIENARLGKNPDGSCSRDFPADTTLREALLELGLDVNAVESRWCGGVVINLGATQLHSLTEDQIQTAITECHVASW